MHSQIWLALVVASALRSVLPAQDEARPWPATDDVREACGALVAEDERYGVAIGVVRDEAREFYGFGHGITADTRFEIGSISKVFTALLLADLIDRKVVALDDTVQSLLPDDVEMPRTEDHEIKLVDLATHHSALPRLPSNFAPSNPRNPYADYSIEQMYAFLSRYDLRREIGERYDYSNLGVGLLGHALARRAGHDYEALIVERIATPLGMSATRITLDEDDLAKLATPHTAKGETASTWDLPTLAGAGAIRSTPGDMTTFVAACLSPPDERFARLLETTLATRERIAPNFEVALAWHITTDEDGAETIWHNGATGGFSSYAGYQPASGVGVVILCNRTNGGLGPDPRALGTRILALLTDS